MTITDNLDIADANYYLLLAKSIRQKLGAGRLGNSIGVEIGKLLPEIPARTAAS